MTWKAEQWRGKIARGKFVAAPMGLDDREAGLTVYDVHPEPLAYCAVCGQPLWHYWEFSDSEGNKLVVGQECARIVTGGTPPSHYLREVEDHRRHEAACREMAARADAYRNWWRAPEQRSLRRILVLGARAERRECLGQDFYRRARRTARAGNLSEKYRQWVERYGDDPVGVVGRTAAAMRQLYALRWCRLGRSGEFVRDLSDRVWSPDPGRVTGAPLTERQCEAIAKMAQRFRAQIAKLAEWQRAA